MDRFTLFPPIVYRPAGHYPLSTPTTTPTITTTTTTFRPPLIQRVNHSVKAPADDFVLITAPINNASFAVPPGTANTSSAFISEGWSIALVVLTSVRLLIVLSLWIYLTRRILNSKVPLNRVWHSQLLLASLVLSHFVLYAFVVSPGPFSCGIVRFGVGFSYALPYALLLLKLIIIASTYRGYDIPQLYQVLLLSSLIGIQIALGAQWLSLVPPFKVIQRDSCGVSVGEWLRHLIYVILLMLCGILMAVFTRHIKSNHRDSMFLGLALGLTTPIWFIWSMIGTLIQGKPGFEDRCLAFGLFITTSIILFVMFLPRSRQLVFVGEGGLYTEDSTSVSKPISELTVHKLYYPVYGDRRLTTSVTGGTAPTQGPQHADVNFRLSSHWYPPIRDITNNTGALPSSNPPTTRSLSRPYQFDDVVCVHHNRPASKHHHHRCPSSIHSASGRLTPPSEEGSTTSSSNTKPSLKRRPDSAKRDLEDDEDDTDLDMDIGKYQERNTEAGILSYSQVVAQQQPMY